MTGSPWPSSSSVIVFLQVCGFTKRLVQGHPGLKQQAADRSGGLP